MSLQEEIESLLMWQDNIQGQDATYQQKASIAINKILDAVDRKIDAEGGEFDPSDDLENGYDDGLAAALKAVKQLRPES